MYIGVVGSRRIDGGNHLQADKARPEGSALRSACIQDGSEIVNQCVQRISIFLLEQKLHRGFAVDEDGAFALGRA